MLPFALRLQPPREATGACGVPHFSGRCNLSSGLTWLFPQPRRISPDRAVTRTRLVRHRILTRSQLNSELLTSAPREPLTGLLFQAAFSPLFLPFSLYSGSYTSPFTHR